ncbi:Serine protease 41, partial [Pseudolycoriella hygida]
MLINAALTAILLTVLYIEEIKCTCGKRIVQYKQLIRKGSETSDGDWPWHSAIFHIGTNVDITYKCGGTLIGSSSVLTAAHCVFEFNRPIIPERILVELGKCNLLNSGTNSQQFQVYTVLLHPSYDSKTFKNDIAIIRLSTVATFNSFIQPICLWPSNLIDVNQIVGKYGTIVGWGLAESDKVSYILRKADMPVVSQIECLESNRELFGNFLSEKTFCAGSRNGTNACQGDSGGGLVFEFDGVFYIRGIISIAKSERNMSCNTDDFVLFTDVAQYLTWIVQSVPELSVSQSHS